MTNSESFQDVVRSRSGRAQLARWMGVTGLLFTIGFGIFARYAEADVPILFWPIIAGGGALLGIHLFYLRWRIRADQRAEP